MKPYRVILYRLPIGRREDVLEQIGEGSLSDAAHLVRSRMTGLAAGKMWQVKGAKLIRHPVKDLRITRLPNFGFGAGLTEDERIAATLRAIPWYTMRECLPGFHVSPGCVADENGEPLTASQVSALERQMPWQIAVIQVTHDRG